MSEPTRLTVFSALGVQAPLEELLAGFKRETAIDIEVTFEPTAVLVALIDKGARPDLIVCTSAAMRDMVERDIVDQSSVALLVRSAIGVAVAPGAPHPDISDVERLTHALVAARAVAYSQSGASGQYFAGLLERLGIAQQVNDRAVLPEKGFIAEALLDGRADLAVQQLSELAVVAEVEIVGPLPEGAQERIELSVGVGSGVVDESAQKLRAHLLSPAGAAVFRAAKLEPVEASPVE